MKILLIEPPITRPDDFSSTKLRIGIVPPIGLASMAAVLEKNGYEVKILDCLIEGQLDGELYSNNRIRYGLKDEDIKYEIAMYNPDIVGVSCLFSAKIYDVLNICKIAKNTLKDVVTVIGGAHPTAAYEEVLKDPNLDFVALGEGEYTLLDLVKYQEKKVNIDNIDGIAYKKGGVICLNPKTKYIENLDELPMPARHLLKMDKYLSTSSPHSGIKQSPFTSILTSRGCPFKCGFCVIRYLWGGKPRYRSAENVLNEIEFLVNTYHIKELHFEDDNFTADRERTVKILNGIIDKGWNISLNSPSGLAIHKLDGELLRLMKKAGYYSISIAIESGDKDVLKLMNKPVDLEKAKNLIKTIRDIGLKSKGFFILGYPGETKEQMNRTIDFAANAGLDWVIFFIATTIPGSGIEKICKENNWFVDKDLDYIRQFYKCNIRTPDFEPDYPEKLKEKANFEINFKNNINIKLGNYERAIEDIGEVVKLYPNLDFAREYLELAERKLNEKHNIKRG